MGAYKDYDPHSPFVEYVEAGWALAAIEPGTKGPRTKGWNTREQAITDAGTAGRMAGAGLLHAYSGTCALDVDDYEGAKGWLGKRGIDLDALLLAEDAVQIRSGAVNRGKLLYTVAEPLRSTQVKDAAGKVLFELRCGASGGLSVQDVLPPSVHPSGKPYTWGGAGRWDDLPPLPEALHRLWNELLTQPQRTAATSPPTDGEKAAAALTKAQLQALREALFFISAEAYDDWVECGMALAELGAQGRALWMAWSQTSDKFDPALAAKKWATFASSQTHWQRVLKLADRRGWLNAGAGSKRREEPPPYPAERPLTAENEPELMVPAGMTVPRIPASILPGWLGDMAAAVAKDTQTPEEASVFAALGILATACHRRWEVEVKQGYVESLALWVMTVMPSGSRKSAVIDHLKSPLTIWEKNQRDRIRGEQGRVQARIAVSEKRLEALKKRAIKADDPEARGKLEKDIEDELAKMPEPVIAPRLYSSDITHERFQQLLVEQEERIAVITDEGGVFATMAGAYSGGNASIDAFLQGYSGTALRVDRGSRLAHVDKPALTFCVSLQPGILADIGKNKKFRDSGLLARFLFAIPPSNVGNRDVRAKNPIPESVRADYEGNIKKLLDRRTDQAKPERLTLSTEALEVWFRFAESVEGRMGPGRELEHLSEWLAKLPGQASRVAGLLHLAKTLGNGSTAVDEDSMKRAVALADRAIGHACGAFNAMGVTAAEDDAAAVLKWLQNTQRREFAIRDVQRGLRGRFPTSAKAELAVDALREWGVVTREYQPPSGSQGGRPPKLFVVNTKVFGTG